MNTASENNIISHLFQQPSLEVVALDDVRSMAEKNPSFAVAQFLLLKKMRDTRHEKFQEQLHKTTLYFNNPLWLEFLLTHDDETTETAQLPTGSTDTETVTTAALSTELSGSTPGVEATSDSDQLSSKADIPVEEKEFMEDASPPFDTLPDTTPGSSPLKDELRRLAEEIQLAKEKKTPEADLSLQTPSFEPYHTIDYFASQGIKLEKIDQNPQDKFGRQLKSFTEWIKTMKRLPQAELQKRLEQGDDARVIADAEVSLEEKEVVTEAMAAVYEKQGLYEKAAGVYHKLSLLNPHKSHYFAAKSAALKK